jgi:Ca2+-binding RTX toxin-like protein
MATFTGSVAADVLDAITGTITGFTGGTLPQLQDTTGDTIDGGQAGDTVVAGGGSDSVRGQLGDDSLNGADGMDTVDGGDGNDTLIGGLGADTLLGGANIDVIRYTSSAELASGESIQGGLGVDTIEIAATGTFNFNTNATIVGVEILDFNLASAGDFASVLIDTSNIGLGAMATIDGSVGTDLLTIQGITGLFDLSSITFTNWTAGIDRTGLIASSTNDTIIGSDGSDEFVGLGGADSLFGGLGDDTFKIDTLGNSISGTTIRGGGGVDELYITGRNGTLVLDGSVTLTSIEKLYFGDRDQVVQLSSTQIGAGKIETVDEIFGVTSGLIVVGNNINLSGVTFTSWSSLDKLLLVGTSGSDTIQGSAAAMTIEGGDGGDLLYGGSLNDVIYGNTATLPDGSSAADTLYGETGNDTLVGSLGGDYINGGGSNDSLSGSGGNDILLGDTGNDTLNGGDGIDYLYSGTGNNTMLGGAGLDILVSEGSNDSMEGGEDQNYYYRQAAGVSSITGSLGVDILVGGLALSNDTFFGFGGDDYALGGEGNDSLLGQDGNDILIGENGNDTLDGGTGVNYLYADGTGNDLIQVNASLLSTQTQLLLFFEAGGVNDSVAITGSTLASFADIQALQASLGVTINGNLLQNTAAGVVMTLGLGAANQTDIWFLGTLAAGLTSADFAFI